MPGKVDEKKSRSKTASRRKKHKTIKFPKVWKDNVPTIHFIMTGGTIDSFWERSKDTVKPHKESVIPQFVKSLDIYENLEFTEICMKDSRELTSEDLKALLKVVEESPHKRIIITHGTYTMSDTAKFLKARLKKKDKIIILTGSLVPLTGFAPSDAPFHLGYAIAMTQKLEPGIYVCMNGRVLEPDEVFKYLYEARFMSIFGEI
ncbi:MAG: asparaginase [Candidatus Aenigmarchaeota archaeon]|nr:asparaginase [Candidatus Aenigmarchaeota archaeon]